VSPHDPYANAPAHYKHPNDRAHIWEGMHSPDSEPDPPSRDFPKHMHKAHGEFIEVHDQQMLDAALLAGWQLEPPKAE
jgi:hypothetical protein